MQMIGDRISKIEAKSMDSIARKSKMKTGVQVRWLAELRGGRQGAPDIFYF